MLDLWLPPNGLDPLSVVPLSGHLPGAVSRQAALPVERKMDDSQLPGSQHVACGQSDADLIAVFIQNRSLICTDRY